MTEQNPSDPNERVTTDEVTFAATPVAHGRGRRAGRAALWVAVGAVGATALSGVAFAANRSESPAPTPSGAPSAPHAGPSGVPAPPAGAPGMRGPGGRGHGMGGELGFGIGEVLHGEFVVKDGDGTKTMLGQQGTVTAASSTSLTVKSSDGFVGTWTLDSSTTKVAKVAAFAAGGKASTLGDLENGQDVTVIGTKSTATSGAATMVRVRPTQAQLDELRKNAPQRPWGDGRRHGRPGTAPTPSASPSAAA